MVKQQYYTGHCDLILFIVSNALLFKIKMSKELLESVLTFHF